MRICLFVSLLGLALLGSTVMGADDPPPDQKKPTETKTGVLSEKPGTAGEGVVAILTVAAEPKPMTKEEKKAERKAKKHGGGDATPASEKINLIAQDAMATKLIDMAKRGVTADVTGILDGASMKVTDVLEKVGGDTSTTKHNKKNKGP
jgi:hypothetical protein